MDVRSRVGNDAVLVLGHVALCGWILVRIYSAAPGSAGAAGCLSLVVGLALRSAGLVVRPVRHSPGIAMPRHPVPEAFVLLPTTRSSDRDNSDGSALVMSFDPQELLLYALLVAGTALIAHSFTRDFMRSSAFVAIGCSLINVGHEIVRHDFHIRPSDA